MKLNLTIMEGNNKGIARTFGEGEFSIGRREDMDFVIDDQYVSREHFLLNISKQNASILDLESTGGTFVNGKRVRETELSDGDEIKIGKTRIAVRIIGRKYDDEGIEIGSEENGKLKLTVIEGNNKGIARSFGEGKFYIGRGEDMDFVIDDGYVSRKHLSIDVSRGKIYISDLKSKNGTFVNGKRVRETELSDGDEIKIGKTTILVRIKDIDEKPKKSEETRIIDENYIFRRQEGILDRMRESIERRKLSKEEKAETIKKAELIIMNFMVKLLKPILKLNKECSKKECDVKDLISCLKSIIRVFKDIEISSETEKIINKLEEIVKYLIYLKERGERLSEEKKNEILEIVDELIDNFDLDNEKFLRGVM